MATAQRLIGDTVAIVIGPIGDFILAGMHQRIKVIAVPGQRARSERWETLLAFVERVPETVAVLVDEIDGLRPIIDHAVAILIDAIAHEPG